MKIYHLKKVISVFIIINSLSYCQLKNICGTVQPELIENHLSKSSATGSNELAVVLIDFPEGRIQPGNILPTSDSDLSYFGNDNSKLNSIGGMGYVKDPNNPDNLIRKIRKYTYDDYWDWVFSDSPVWTGTRHPDYDVAGAEVTTYGSLKDYYKEVSYNHLIITPVQTWSGPNDKYHTGIINPTDTANGKRYIHWIMMPNRKSTYYNTNIYPQKFGPLEEVKPVLRELKASGAIEFDVDSYLSGGGKILIIVAGGQRYNCSQQGTPGHDGQLLSVTEKRYLNYNSYSTLGGIAPMVHEYGHTLGFTHIASGTYDPMNLIYYDNWTDFLFCPPHFNPIYKLQKGWLTPDDVERVSSTKNISLTPITSENKKVALVTLYGDAGRNGEYNHSEYLALEYKTRDGFNRFSGGVDSPGFSGGVLIWHFSKYDNYYFNNGFESSSIGLKISNYADNNNNTDSYYRLQNPSDFYYPAHNLIDQNSNPNTNSILHLPTGISLSDFSISGDRINIAVNYTLGNLPVYNEFYTAGTSQASISGNAYIEGNLFFTNLLVNDNSVIDCAPGSQIIAKYISAVGLSAKGIKFQGAGLDNSRVKWNGINLQNNDAQQSKIMNCLISDVTYYSNSNAVFININDSGIEPVISSNYFQNNVNDLFFCNTDKLFKNLQAYDNRFSLNSKMKIIGNWNIIKTFTVPKGNELKIESYFDEHDPSMDNIPTNIKFESGAGLYCIGRLEVNGTSTYHVNLISNDSSVNWGSIILNGAGTKGSILNYVNMRHGSSIQVMNGTADITIQNSSLSDNTDNIIFTSSSGSVVNNTINGGKNGIIIRNYSNAACNLNTITNCKFGIIYSRASGGYIGGNDIENSDSMGIFIDNNSNPLFKNTPDANSRNNRITLCSKGLVIHNSYPVLYNSTNCNGLNSIYGNHAADFEYNNKNGFILNAENNFWNRDDSAEVSIQGKEDLVINPICLNDPWKGVSLHTGNQGSVASVNTNKNELSDNKIQKDKLIGNYPNPFNPTTLIRYQITGRGHVVLKVYNILGEEVTTLVDKIQEPGIHAAAFNGSAYASGVYIYQLSTNGNTQIKKMLMIK